ncbi:MAG TPA: response regulator transcription factor [Eudoraea sp.]|nr:response regulator transcription factor [Eudoraea sp.]
MKTNILNIIVIDHDPQILLLYKIYFESYPDFELKGIYGSVQEALQDFENTVPDIIFSEVNLPDIDGIEGIALFRKKDPDVKIIINSVESDFGIIKTAFKNGANGYLSKPVTRKRLYHALNSIRSEGAIMSNDIAKKVISMFQRKSYQAFSKRENQIIDYLCQGATYKIIAEKLFVTTSAINFHIQNIYLKLDVNSKSEALTKLQTLELA